MHDKSSWSGMLVIIPTDSTRTSNRSFTSITTKDWSSKSHGPLCSIGQGVIRLSRTSGSFLTRHGHLNMRFRVTTFALAGVRGLPPTFQDFWLIQRCLRRKISRPHEPGNCFVFSFDTKHNAVDIRATLATTIHGFTRGIRLLSQCLVHSRTVRETLKAAYQAGYALLGNVL